MTGVTHTARILLVLVALVISHVGAEERWEGTLGAHVGSGNKPLDESFHDTAGHITPRLPNDLGVSPLTMKRQLSAVRSAPQPQMRGAREAQLYAKVSPRVVMVVTNDAIGSGALIQDAVTVLTNWHVIEGYDTVGVIYKPATEGQAVSAADIRRAKVIRVDEVADLALLKVEVPPAKRATISLGDLADVPVGSDVHAIGHPTGESWTYTKGFVSQMRQDYEWVTESGKVHRADVVQTQTPINPGNSGGPLLSDKYTLVGVNSFKAKGEGLNFAVSVDEVRTFLARTEDRYAQSARQPGSASSPEDCEIHWMGSERSQDPAGMEYFADVDCDGKIDGSRLVPDNPNEPVIVSIDSTGDNLIDTVFFDNDRDGGVDLSIYDTDADGEPDLVGHHRNGESEPYTYEEY